MSSEVRILPYPRREKNHLADVAQLVEHVLGKDEVTGSIPVISSTESRLEAQGERYRAARVRSSIDLPTQEGGLDLRV